MTADRILSPTESTQDGDRMTVTLTRRDGLWCTKEGLAVEPALIPHGLRDPSTVITRPAPAEPDWQPGDVVRDTLGRLFERAHIGWRMDGVIYRDELPARPLTLLVPEVKA